MSKHGKKYCGSGGTPKDGSIREMNCGSSTCNNKRRSFKFESGGVFGSPGWRCITCGIRR